MAKFSQRSLARLHTCHPDLVKVFIEVIRQSDCVILCGHRTKEEQDAAVAAKVSKTPWPTSKHNQTPSLAVDAAPYPIDWKAYDRFTALSNIVLRVAANLHVRIRWGGDWNENGSSADERFLDMPHYELV